MADRFVTAASLLLAMVLWLPAGPLAAEETPEGPQPVMKRDPAAPGGVAAVDATAGTAADATASAAVDEADGLAEVAATDDGAAKVSGPPATASPEVYRDFGEYYLRHGQVEQAEASFRNALKRAPTAISLHISLAEVLRLQGRADEAITVLEAAQNLDPTGLEVRNNLGVALIDMDRLAEAEALYHKLLEDYPDYHIGFVNLGVAQLKSGRIAEAVTQYNRAIAIDPDNVNTYYNIGNAYLEGGQPEDAIDWYDRALERDRDQAHVLNNRAIALRAMGRLDEAAEGYGQAIALDESDPDFFFNLGVVQAEMDLVEDAIISYRRVMDRDDTYPGVHNNQGTNYFRSGVYTAAEDEFLLATEQHEDDPVPHNNLCVLYLVRKKAEQALTACERATELRPNYRDPAYNRIQALLRLGRYEGAVTDAKSLVERIPTGKSRERAEVLTALSAAHFGLGDMGKALKVGKWAVETDPQLSRAHYNLGRVYQQTNRNGRAMESYERAVALSLRDADAYLRLGEIYDRLGRRADAEQAYRRGGRLKID